MTIKLAKLIEELAEKTESYCGEWGKNHCLRLLESVKIISEDVDYDASILKLAIWLHDWGAYPEFVEVGKDHAIRSQEVARTYLTDNQIDEEVIEHVLECIGAHHSATYENSIEAQILFDADTIDFVGLSGILREFSRYPKDLRKAYESAYLRATTFETRPLLSKSKAIVASRAHQMRGFLRAYSLETNNLF